MTIVDSERAMLMPVRTGRDSSLAAAKAVLEMAVLRSLGLMDAVRPSVRAGAGGKSLGSAPWMLARALAQVRLAIMEPSGTFMLTGSFGRVLTNSVKSLAGMVMAPSRETMAATLVLMVMVRLVAVRVMPSGSVFIRDVLDYGYRGSPGTARENGVEAFIEVVLYGCGLHRLGLLGVSLAGAWLSVLYITERRPAVVGAPLLFRGCWLGQGRWKWVNVVDVSEGGILKEHSGGWVGLGVLSCKRQEALWFWRFRPWWNGRIGTLEDGVDLGTGLVRLFQASCFVVRTVQASSAALMLSC